MARPDQGVITVHQSEAQWNAAPQRFERRRGLVAVRVAAAIGAPSKRLVVRGFYHALHGMERKPILCVSRPEVGHSLRAKTRACHTGRSVWYAPIRP